MQIFKRKIRMTLVCHVKTTGVNIIIIIIRFMRSIVLN